jgi:hypothetical protein
VIIVQICIINATKRLGRSSIYIEAQLRRRNYNGMPHHRSRTKLITQFNAKAQLPPNIL